MSFNLKIKIIPTISNLLDYVKKFAITLCNNICFQIRYALVFLYDGTCYETKELDTLTGAMPNDDKWVIYSSGRHMFVSLWVGFEYSSKGFLAKIHYGNEIKDIKTVCQKYSYIYFQSIVQR